MPDWTTRPQRFTAPDRHYDLDRFERHLYVTTEEWRALHPMNGRVSGLIDNKGLLPALAASIADMLPPTSLYVMGDRFVRWHRGASDVRPRHELRSAVADHLQEHGDLVLRPLGGSGGSGVSAITTLDQLERHERTRWQFVLTTRLLPAPFTAAVWPHALNTMRVNAHQSRGGGLRILRIFQRFGTAATGVVDNRAAGGVLALVDVATGRLTVAYCDPKGLERPSGTLTTITHHPDSGVPITGTAIPDWPDVRRQIDRLLGAFGFLTIAGFDTALTPDGLKLIEVNSVPSIGGIQIEEPALLDVEFRELFLAMRSGHRLVP
jgi:hypothetical protein